MMINLSTHYEDYLRYLILCEKEATTALGSRNNCVKLLSPTLFNPQILQLFFITPQQDNPTRI